MCVFLRVIVKKPMSITWTLAGYEDQRILRQTFYNCVYPQYSFGQNKIIVLYQHNQPKAFVLFTEVPDTITVHFMHGSNFGHVPMYEVAISAMTAYAGASRQIEFPNEWGDMWSGPRPAPVVVFGTGNSCTQESFDAQTTHVRWYESNGHVQRFSN